MMPGITGNTKGTLINITWEQFKLWQRWDEFPERSADPPMTVDMTFWYHDNRYYLDSIDHQYAILTENWHIVAAD